MSIEIFLEKVNSHLETLLPETSVPFASLYEGARYSLLAPGKRIRPLLVLTIATMLGKDLSSALSPACALEMVHTYSLIHDDLPCMDNDDFRRGKPTLHRLYSEGHAVLVGDFLLTYAFEVIAKAGSLSAEQKIALIDELSKASGGEGMIAGQIMDIAFEKEKIDLETLEKIHHHKTGALIAVAFRFGEIIGNFSSDVLKEIGRSFGFLYQIVDDLLDYSSDVKKNKASFVTHLGQDKTRKIAYSLYEEMLSKLKLLPCDSVRLKTLMDKIIQQI